MHFRVCFRAFWYQITSGAPQATKKQRRRRKFWEIGTKNDDFYRKIVRKKNFSRRLRRRRKFFRIFLPVLGGDSSCFFLCSCSEILPVFRGDSR